MCVYQLHAHSELTPVRWDDEMHAQRARRKTRTRGGIHLQHKIDRTVKSQTRCRAQKSVPGRGLLRGDTSTGRIDHWMLVDRRDPYLGDLQCVNERLCIVDGTSQGLSALPSVSADQHVIVNVSFFKYVSPRSCRREISTGHLCVNTCADACFGTSKYQKKKKNTRTQRDTHTDTSEMMREKNQRGRDRDFVCERRIRR